MTKRNVALDREELKRTLAGDPDFLRPLVQTVVQEILETEMDECVGAEKGARSESRQATAPSTSL
jgi:putative transposase